MAITKADLTEYLTCDDADALVYQVVIEGDLDPAAREEQLRQLGELILPPERETGREVLIMQITRGPLGDTGTTGILTLDALSKWQVTIQDLLRKAYICQYVGADESNCRYDEKMQAWRTNFTAEAGRTMVVYNFARLLDLQS